MPTQAEKVESLTSSMVRVETTIQTHENCHRQSDERIDRLRDENSELRERVAKLEQVIAELKASLAVWGQRAWALAAGLGLALIGGVIAYYRKG